VPTAPEQVPVGIPGISVPASLLLVTPSALIPRFVNAEKPHIVQTYLILQVASHQKPSYKRIVVLILVH
jgi:hypothetical protein